jgi:hypothetical protein
MFKKYRNQDDGVRVRTREGVMTTGVTKRNSGAGSSESVADTLERELQPIIVDWLCRVEREPDLTCIPLDFEQRTGHLPQLLRDVIMRLRLGGDESAGFGSCGHPRRVAA